MIVRWAVSGKTYIFSHVASPFILVDNLLSEIVRAIPAAIILEYYKWHDITTGRDTYPKLATTTQFIPNLCHLVIGKL